MEYALRSTTNKEDLRKLKNFCKAKKITMSRTKQQTTDWEKIFTNPTFDRDVLLNVCKELKKVDSKTPNNSIKNGVQS